MKKYFLTALAVAALVACGGNSQKAAQGEATDSTETVADAAAQSEEAQFTVSAMKSSLENASPADFQQALGTIKEQVATIAEVEPEKAKTYVESVQTFLKENAEKIQSVAGEQIAQTAALIASIPSDKLVQTIKENAASLNLENPAALTEVASQLGVADETINSIKQSVQALAAQGAGEAANAANAVNDVVEKGAAAVEQGKAVVEQGKAVVEQGKAAVEQGKAVVEQGKAAVEQGKAKVEQQKEAVEKQKEVVNNLKGKLGI